MRFIKGDLVIRKENIEGTWFRKEILGKNPPYHVSRIKEGMSLEEGKTDSLQFGQDFFELWERGENEEEIKVGGRVRLGRWVQKDKAELYPCIDTMHQFVGEIAIITGLDTIRNSRYAEIEMEDGRERDDGFGLWRVKNMEILHNKRREKRVRRYGLDGFPVRKLRLKKNG